MNTAIAPPKNTSRRRRFRFFIVPFVAAALVPRVRATAEDLTIFSKVSSDKNPPKTAVSYLSRDRVRMAQGEGGETILDFKTGELTTLDARNKTFYVTTREDLARFAAQIKKRMEGPEMKKAQEELKKLPPEKRKKMESEMSAMFGTFDVRKTGAKRRIAGYSCEQWVITFGQFSRTEECLTSDVQFPAQAWDMYRDFAASLKSMMAGFGPLGKSVENIKEKFKDMKGYPLATSSSVKVMGHETVTTSEVTEIRRGPIPGSAWKIPDGYRKVDSPMKKAFPSSR